MRLEALERQCKSQMIIIQLALLTWQQKNVDIRPFLPFDTSNSYTKESRRLFRIVVYSHLLTFGLKSNETHKTKKCAKTQVLENRINLHHFFFEIIDEKTWYIKHKHKHKHITNTSTYGQFHSKKKMCLFNTNTGVPELFFYVCLCA